MPFDRGDLIGTPLGQHVHPDDTSAATRFLTELARRRGAQGSHEWRMRLVDGPWRTVEAAAANRLNDPELDAIVLTIRDVTERKALEDQLRHQAFHDPLTQLANRSLFSDRLSHALERHARAGMTLAVLFIDLDEFKQVNDRLGHEVGDQVMSAVGQRLSGALRTEDTAARLGGDEFAVLLEGADARQAVAVAERILTAFRQPLAIAGETMTLGLSLGIAVSRATTRSGSDLLRNADLAMYMAKMTGRSRYEVFRESAEEALLAANRWEPGEPDRTNVVWLARADQERAGVRELLEDPSQIRPVFQPIVEIASGQVAGYEALARFEALPDRPPNAVFAQAHRYGLGSFLEANAIAAELSVPGRPTGAFLTLNVSPTALASRVVQQALPKSLEGVIIEMTENEVAEEGPAVAQALDFIRRRHGRLAIDDAGAGYAGLRHLMILEPDLIKLDLTLTQNIHADLRKAALVESLVNYAQRISAETCAEGVENPRDLESVRELGVTYAQGHLLGRPASGWEVEMRQIAEALALAGDPSEALEGREAEASYARITQLLAVATSWQEVDDVLALLTLTLAADMAYLSRVDEEGGYLLLLAARGKPNYDVPYPIGDYPTTAEVLESRVPYEVRTSDPGADPREVEFLLAEGMRSGLLYPVVHGGRSVGLLEVFCDGERHWTIDELAGVGSVCEQLGEVMHRISVPRQVARV